MSIILLGALAAAVTAPQVAVEHAVFTAATMPSRLDFRLAAASLPTVDPRERRLRLISADLPSAPPERVDLVSIDREAGRTGTVIRHPHLTAGVSLRLIGDSGQFAPALGMAGAAGRALARLATESDIF